MASAVGARSLGAVAPRRPLCPRRTATHFRAGRSGAARAAPGAPRASAAAAVVRAPDLAADPAATARALAEAPARGAATPDEARALYSAGWAFLDVRSALELETEGKIAPKMEGSLHAPLVDFTKRYDAAAGRKTVDKAASPGFVAAVRKLAPDTGAGLILVCSGVPSQGQLRAAQAKDALAAAGYSRLVVLEGGAAAWALAYTNKLEKRVVGFTIASGGTSIEQRGGVSSKGSGVAGKSADALKADMSANYAPGGVYADA